MDVRDKIKNGEYTNKLPYSMKPRMPVLPKKATPDEIRKHADDVEAYDAQIVEWKAALEAFRKETAELMQLFRADVEAENGTVANKKAELLWTKAWSRGHSDSLTEVLNVYEDLVELIL